MTDSNGNYVLDALPIATASGTPITYYVVTQPYSQPSNAVLVDYPPQASAPFSTTSPGIYSAAGFTTFNLAFPATQATVGSIQASITPGSLFGSVSQSTWVEVSQPLPAPAGQTAVVPTLIIRSTNAATTAATLSAAATDNVYINGLPAGVPYTVTSQRTTSLAPGTLLAAPVPEIYNGTPTLTSGQTADVSFTYTATGTVPAS
jgi:hypothetical protein